MGIAVDSRSGAYVTGSTSSDNFPTTPTAFQASLTNPGGHYFDVFVAKLVVNNPSVARAGPDRTIILGETAQFDASGSHDTDGTIANFHWAFGDGGTADGATVTHAYASAGTFTVTLTVTDNGAATAADTATVTVKTPAQAIQDLSALVATYNLQQGIANSLDTKLQNALAALQAANAGQRQDATNKLLALMNAVEAQRGKELTTAQADELVA
jgi:hypothetical protein